MDKAVDKLHGGKYDRINAWNELPRQKGVFLVGGNSHSRDYRDGGGGGGEFVSGLRYTARTTVQVRESDTGRNIMILFY